MINVLIVCLTFLISVFYVTNKCVSYLRNRNFKDTLGLFEYFLEQSYKTTYENDLVLYMSSSEPIPPNQRETIERNYVKQTLMYMGKNVKRFTDFYGSEQTMIVHVLQYLRRKINEDGLSKLVEKQTETAIQ